MKITYKLAMAAGQDAANRQARKAGRQAWALCDWELAAETTNKLLDPFAGERFRLVNRESGSGDQTPIAEGRAS